LQTSFSKLRIVVLGYIVRGPLGGLVWHHLQYVLGLKKMGHEVLFLEDSDNYASCYNPQKDEMTTDPSYGIDFIRQVFEQFGLVNQWAYYNEHISEWFGQPEKKVHEFCRNADILLNISGVNPLRNFLMEIPRRVLIDTDPVFTQLKHLTEPEALSKAKKHTHFFSFGENINQSFCSIPLDGITWQATRQPIVLEFWKYQEGKADAAWSTVMQWDSYKPGEYKGRTYGMKSASFASYLDFPMYSTESFDLAIGSPTAPTELLKQKRWNVLNSVLVTKTTESYQQFIQQSKGEWSVAKEGYVISNSGWFSERSTVYLATGRPVVVQDTGFSKFLETGKGLFSFTSVDQALTAIEEINSGYTNHCRWARDLVEHYFNYNTVLTGLLDRINFRNSL